MTPAETAAELWDRIISLVDGLDDADWGRATPCTGWDVRDVVGHLSGIQLGFDAGTYVPPPEAWEPPADAPPMSAWTEAGVAARRGWDTERLRSELQEARDGHVARLAAVTDWSAPADGPVGRTTEDGLFQVRMFDLWVHLQDLLEGLGRPLQVDDPSEAARVAHTYVIGLVPYLFVKRVGAQEHDALALRLGKPIDRDTVVEVSVGRGRFNPDADAGGNSVEGSPGALTLLCSGRHGAAHWRELGLLDWSGSGGEEFVERARLF